MQLNEGKACDAILRHVEGREGASRSNMRWPEEEGHVAPVESVCNIGNQLYAVEHTGIEPFGGLLQLNNQADEHFGPIIEAISGVVPDDEVYELVIPARALHQKRRREVRQVQRALIAWIKETAPTLPKRRYAHYPKPAWTFTVQQVPFSVQLYRFEGSGRLQIKHVVTGDREACSTGCRRWAAAVSGLASACSRDVLASERRAMSPAVYL
jgi:hypothetical protein